MPLKKITKAEIISISLEVFRKNGYHNTAMSDLAIACNLQKGSFYHYFDSKEILMTEILINTFEFLKKDVFSIAKEEILLPRDRMEKMLKKLSLELLIKNGGCIVGNITMETAQIIPAFKDILNQIFDCWVESLKIIYQTKFSIEIAQRLAEQTVMEFEGAVMLTKIYGGDRYFRDCYSRVISRM